jgi:hypothetical protein
MAYVQSIGNASVPREGSKSVLLPFAFASGTQTLQENISLASFNMSCVQSMLIDNSQCPYATTVTLTATGQNVVTSANSQQIVPVISNAVAFNLIVYIAGPSNCVVNVSLMTCYVPPAQWSSNPGSASPGGLNLQYIVLTSGTSWTVPANWMANGSQILGIGAGGNGAYSSGAGGSGTGGDCAFVVNAALTPGASIPYQIGLGGGSVGAGTGPTANTWFENAATLIAAGGASASGTSSGAASSGANSVGAVIHRGGAGFSGGGGGGAGGFYGVGAAGSYLAGGNADASQGGAGGGLAAAPGGNGTEFAGIGSGGGGGPGSPAGQNGGLYGGAGSGNNELSTAGSGANGVIIISYYHT